MSQHEISALNDQAFALLDKGDRQGAKSLFEKVCELDNEESEARMMLGVIYAELGDLRQAEDFLRQTLTLDAKYADAYFHLSNVVKTKGNVNEAISLLDKAIEYDPDFSDASALLCELCINQANKLVQSEKIADAIPYYERLTTCQPEKAMHWFLLGRSFGQLERYSEAEKYVNKALVIDPNFVEAHYVLVSFLLDSGKTDEAQKHSDRALELDPDNVNVIAMAANLAKRVGDFEKSYGLLQPLLKDGVRDINIVHSFAMISTDIGKQEEAIAMLEELITGDTQLKSVTKSNLHFNLGLLYDNIKKYDDAFINYQSGNNLRQVRYDSGGTKKYFDDSIMVFSKNNMLKMPVSSIRSEKPVFVVGMVRSGTSLVEQILSSHPEVYGAGELGDIWQLSLDLPEFLGSDVAYPKCVRQIKPKQMNTLASNYLRHLEEIAPDAKRVVDKLPANFMYLGLIEKLFPDARIIHCMRNPIDTCLSAYFQNFSVIHPYAYDLGNLVSFYQDYLRMMKHWRKVLKLPMLEVQYEDLISGQEETSRALIDFCELEWDEQCLRFHDSKRFVRTASFDQVNKPVYKKSVARWKNYERHIQTLVTGFSHP